MPASFHPRLVPLLALACLGGCGASPPLSRDGSAPPPSQSRFASLVRCTPPTSAPAPACPGPVCPDNAVGAPDSQTADLGVCPTLDLVFTGGTIVASGKGDDLALHLGPPAGLARVEGSRDGLSYVILGFVAASSQHLPAGTRTSCTAIPTGNRASLSLDRCNSISNVGFLRISRDARAAGSTTIDAAEAVSFVPISQ